MNSYVYLAGINSIYKSNLKVTFTELKLVFRRTKTLIFEKKKPINP